MPVDLLYQRGCEIHGRETLDIEQRGAFDKIVERRGADLYGGRIDREGRVAFCRLVEVDQQTTAIVRKATMRRRKAYGADRESDRGPGLVYLPSLCSTVHMRTDTQTAPRKRATDLWVIFMPRWRWNRCFNPGVGLLRLRREKTRTYLRDRPPTTWVPHSINKASAASMRPAHCS